ncbi:MAG: CoA-binding protein [Candidatus Lokiarchaeota archaeon]|nr:CoA-binding protein [Candidatus Lokiarchaeota archaeon]
MSLRDNINLNVKDLSLINKIKSMAVIGTSVKRNFFFLRNHYQTFKGPVYAINPSVKRISGFPQENIFASIKDVPGEVDFAFITVQKNRVLNIIDDCVEKGVKLVSIFTAEFSDAGTEEGIEMENELLRRANNKIRMLGPNGMGLFYPKIGIQWRDKFPTEAGNIGFVAQSGGICNIAIYTAKELGFHFSKVFSFGNGADIDIVDLISFLEEDPETDIILCYLEGVKKDRGDLLRTKLKNATKPIAVLKGGRTNKGAIAAKTHTASISGNNKIWESIFKQANVMEVNSLEQLLNLANIIDCYGIKKMENAAVFSISGGYGVVLVDLLENAGIKIPNFSFEIQEKLDKLFFIRGTSSKNPLDVAAQLFWGDSIQKIIDIALSDEKMDFLIMDLPSYYFDPTYFFNPVNNFKEMMIETLCLGQKYGKPIIPILQRTHTPDIRREIAKILIENKVPIFGEPLEVIPLLPIISRYAKKRG